MLILSVNVCEAGFNFADISSVPVPVVVDQLRKYKRFELNCCGATAATV